MTAPHPILPALFDAAVATAELDLFGDAPSPLLPEEAAALATAASARLLEFQGGRHCARVALAELGLQGKPVLRADDRAPVWPDGFVGSIAHTRRGDRGFCGAVVARASQVRSVGLDLELDEPLDRKLWRRVLTDGERALLEAMPEAEQGFRGKLVFSAKECVYKCQYPLSHQFLEFGDVEITIDVERAELEGTLLRDAGPFGRGAVFRGRYVRAGGVIATGVTLR